jgi:hypothetical protein
VHTLSSFAYFLSKSQKKEDGRVCRNGKEPNSDMPTVIINFSVHRAVQQGANGNIATVKGTTKSTQILHPQSFGVGSGSKKRREVKLIATGQSTSAALPR